MNDRFWADALSCPVKYNRYNNLNRQYISDIDLTKGNTGRSWDNDVKYNSQVTIRVYTGILHSSKKDTKFGTLIFPYVSSFDSSFAAYTYSDTL